MSGSEDMIGILVGERDRALREVMSLERERYKGIARARRWKKLAREFRRWWRTTAELSDEFQQERDEARAHVEEQHQESLRLIEGLNVAHRERDEARARLSQAEELLRACHMHIYEDGTLQQDIEVFLLLPEDCLLEASGDER